MIETVKNLIEPIMNENGYRIFELKYLKEGPNHFLRLVIEKDGIIDVDDCVNVTKLINPILDEKEPIKENYILDVCSKESGE